MVMPNRHLPFSRRAHNAANETGTVSGGGWTSPTHDAAGNMASSPVPQDETVSQGYVFDAWNRLLEVRDNTNALIFSFEYDGLARRMSRYNAADSTPTTHLYYQDLQGRLLEIARAGTTRYFDHYVYGLDGHIPLVRYRDTDANGSMDETQHYTWDANGNITSMLNLSGSVVERYTYEAYGRPSFWSGSWATRTGPAHGNRILFGAAYFQDRDTDLYFANARYYHSTLGRFISRDPLADAYQDGPNLYQYVGSNPVNWVDPEGIERRSRTYTPRKPAMPPKQYHPIEMRYIQECLAKCPKQGTSRNARGSAACRSRCWESKGTYDPHYFPGPVTRAPGNKFLGCMANCIEDNDPTAMVLDATAILIGPLPKTPFEWMSGRSIRPPGSGDITCCPSRLNSALGKWVNPQVAKGAAKVGVAIGGALYVVDTLVVAGCACKCSPKLL